ncbi:Asp-tRNA(Asn)/Glu-tRNA(Gln) amidotransferase subunit GatB [Candidatus Giovannonibacteria bacterium]|nr:Asp-tRNA(Asn)/Glu-tRNA(Gln) amidotransferase subunit GatB [Candidatus Giovannonibacteria bacterium]
MKFEPTIGLEIHAELKTKTKMFCECLNDPLEKRPNLNLCPICLGHPGTLPLMNKEAVRLVLTLGAALGAKLADDSRFDRKNYFYPDLPKGYQISQYLHPLVSAGVLKLPSGKEVRITRVHLEEDAARNVHDNDSKATLVDFNRAGVPLMELVTEPDMKSAAEAVEFAEELQLILRYLGISDADMEKGQMRVEANVSIAPADELGNGFSKLGTKVEVKNINSFRAVGRAIDFEINRQAEAIGRGEKIKQETRGWDDAHQKTVSQRSKEEAHDYRYFPEPDLPPLKLSEVPEFAPEILKAELPELPLAKRERFREEYGVEGEKLEIFIHDKKLSEFFESVVSEAERWIDKVPKEKIISLAVNYITSDLVGLLKELALSIENLEMSPENFGELIKMSALGEISSRGAKDILRIMTERGGDPTEIAIQEGQLQTSETGSLEGIVKRVIDANPKALEDYKKGKEASLQFLIGQAMREAKNQKIGANPQILKEIFQKISK